MDFNPEVEHEAIMEEVQQKLDRPIVNPSNNFWRDLTRTKNPISNFQIGDSIIYTNEVHNDMVDLLYIKPMILIALSTSLISRDETQR